jgi:hypothetical protein
MKSTASLVLILALAGCAGSTPSQSEDSAGASAAPRSTSSALRVGQTHEAGELATTLLEVDYPFTGDEKHVAPEGSAFVGLDTKTCNDSANKPTLTASNSDWTLVGATGVLYAGTKDVSWADWPLPKFPEGSPLEPGKCSYGWVLIQVPGNEQFSAVHLKTPGSDATATWKGTFARN